MKQKSEHLLQAQAATFAHEAAPSKDDAYGIFDNLTEVATGIPAPVEVAYSHPLDPDRISATQREYVNFLRSVGGQKHEGIRERAKMLDAYATFAPRVAGLHSELGSMEEKWKHETFLGAGTNTSAFLLEQDGKKYAVRGPGTNGRSSSAFIDQRVATGILTRGMPHVEQIVAASYESGNVVAELAPGKEIGKLSLDQIGDITDEQLGELADTAIELSRRGVFIDSKSSNFFYDPVEGFTIIDLAPKTGATIPEVIQKVPLSQGVASVASTLRMAGSKSAYEHRAGGNSTVADYEHEYDMMLASDALLPRYRAVIAEKLTGPELIDTLERIDKFIEDRSSAEKGSKHEYVTEAQRLDEDWRQRQQSFAATTEENWV